jgi:hypothetical protein
MLNPTSSSVRRDPLLCGRKLVPSACAGLIRTEQADRTGAGNGRAGRERARRQS